MPARMGAKKGPLLSSGAWGWTATLSQSQGSTTTSSAFCSPTARGHQSHMLKAPTDGCDHESPSMTMPRRSAVATAAENGPPIACHSDPWLESLCHAPARPCTATPRGTHPSQRAMATERRGATWRLPAGSMRGREDSCNMRVVDLPDNFCV
eukprot:5085328-Pyramimonas_sp.AAC.1